MTQRHVSVKLSSFGFGDAEAACEPGEVLTGGGFSEVGATIIHSLPSGNSWSAYGQGDLLGGVIVAYALCAEIG